MKANVVGIFDRGQLVNERVHFKALCDLDLAFINVLDTEVISAIAPSVEAGNKNCYWFASYKVKAGENVVLYTRAGTFSKEVRPDGSVFHFFFRGKSTAAYASPHSRAVIFEIDTWRTAG